MDAFAESLDQPVATLSARLASWPDACLLESSAAEGESDRWSILTAQPRFVFEMSGDAWTLTEPFRTQHGRSQGLEALSDLLNEHSLAAAHDTPDPDFPHFQGGMIGYLGYDLAPRIERLPRKARAESSLPDVRLGFYDTAIIHDHANGQTRLWAFDLLNEGKAAVEQRAQRWKQWLSEPIPPVQAPRLKPIRSGFTKERYLETVRRSLDYITAGDVFQVNLSQRFETSADGPIDPAWLHAQLRSSSLAPFSALLRWNDKAVVSASPELFYKTSGRRIVTRPIKGTRSRSSNPVQDEANRQELLHSSKDHAELTMIVDLERNDLGRVCTYGSVRVTDALQLETFPQVHHLVATVEGTLRQDVGPVDVLRAVFPGGSITGAPKIRAMEIIDELEPSRRSLYTGAIGYFGRGGASQFNIAIRTVLVEGNRLSYQVGGGIVADSSPEDEFQETLHKGRGIRLALESAMTTTH